MGGKKDRNGKGNAKGVVYGGRQGRSTVGDMIGRIISMPGGDHSLNFFSSEVSKR